MARVEPLVVIVGPTASGKTALAVEVAKKYNGEVIAADSRTIYKGMDIGTAKPTAAEVKDVKHHLISIVEPDQSFTVADFKLAADKAIKEISNRGKLPIIVGGSGLYVNSVIYNYDFASKNDSAQREDLNALSVAQLQQKLNEQNIPLPENSNNKRYLIRNLEAGGTSKNNNVVRNNTLILGISTDKGQLKQRIKARVEEMLQRGVLEETKQLAQKYSWDSEPMKSNIYRVLKRYINGDIDLETAKQEIAKADMKLVKKQITWFKRDKNIKWGNPKELLAFIDEFVKKVN